MPEVLEEQNSEPFDVQRYLDVARRRYPYFLIFAFVGWLVVWGVSWILPVSYKSGTLILVEQPTMPKDYVVSNINEDLQDRVQNITQQILSRTRLLHIIDELNLYSGNHSQLTPDEKAARMRKDIEIELVRDSHNLQITAFKIDYSAHDPHVAQRVTSELTNLFINENLEVRQQQSEDTTRFLQTQLEAARQSLAEQEAKIRVFKGESRRRIAYPAGDESPDPKRLASAATERTGSAKRGTTAASLLRDADQSISESARDFSDGRRRSDGFAGD